MARWNKTTTWKNRYNDFGVTGLIQRLDKTELRVMDVGCSRGVTIKHCQKTLQKQGIAIKTIGVDGKEEVWDEAEKNIDQLIRHDAAEVNGYEGTADVVVCMNAIRFIHPKDKKDVLKKCVVFLKDDGMLITNVENFEIKNTAVKFMNVSNISTRVFMWIHRTRMLDKTNAGLYAENVTACDRSRGFRILCFLNNLTP